ncbi:helix-turn-helix domain-containing protein [Nonomuraea terrae]|uniref:Helix-turn-helix domain-containing protein n=1 Tax=Nonomuraea terrae TaxID=2530383 RepID=A0A4V2YIR2_9ACTN|nr:helix-turn-helix domain-containing protein [Nonomuraea terrae]TDD35887.1 helix-turn-helix domain-containing protein [Nonomuraea terrae]
MHPRRIVFVVYDGFQALDLAGPYEVFQQAAWHVNGNYTCEIVAPAAGRVHADSALPMYAEHGVRTLDPRGVDTLVVAGGVGVFDARHDPALTGWISAAGAGARRVASVCTGSFLLAAAGLADGRRVTTHWAHARRLADEHPSVTVDSDPIFVRDGRVWSSAGVTAGMDLSLALVEDDLGRDVALTVARNLVLFLRRPGGQSQFSVALWSGQPSTDPIRAAVAAIHADPGARHEVKDLAEHARLSPRHLQRRFTAELGLPPGAYVERVRIEAAQRVLAESDAPVEVIARRCGFGTAETLRRAFHRRVGVSPSDYRERFGRMTADEPCAAVRR